MNASIIRYIGPSREALPGLIADKRAEWRSSVVASGVARRRGFPAVAAGFLKSAALSRLQLRQLLACRRALDTTWRERSWMPVSDYPGLSS